MSVLTPNLRDVGSLTTGAGHPLVPGRLLRSAVPQAGDLGLDGVEWPPGLVIDLRSASERAAGHPFAEMGSQVVNLPLLAALRPGERRAETLAELYQLMLVEASGHLVDLVRHVGQAPGATLVHCAAGKDRTGVSVALLLRLVGVERDAVMQDYMLTSLALGDIGARLRPAHPDPDAHVYPPGFSDVIPDGMDAVMDVWDRHDGGVHGWFAGAGGENSDIEALHRRLLA